MKSLVNKDIMSELIRKIKFNIRQIEKEVMQHILLPVSYSLAKGKPEEKRVLLADCHHNNCPEEMRLIRKKFKQDGYQVVDYYFDIGSISGVTSFKKMIGFMKEYKKAGVVIICSYFLPVAACKKNKNTKVVNVWHGCGAMKKFGYDADHDIPKDYKGNPFANTDIMCVSGTACVEPFASAMNYPAASVEPIGISVTDIYFNEKYIAKCRDKFAKLYPEASNKKVVLWAPTFRKNAATAACVGEDEIDALSKDSSISEEYYIVKSLHPNMKKHSNNENMSTRELMMCCDILITDYSSVCFDFSLMNKPMIFFAPDYSEYVSERGMYLDYKDMPGVLLLDEEANKLKDILNNHLYDNEQYLLQRKKFSDIYMCGCDGNSTKKLMERLYGKK